MESQTVAGGVLLRRVDDLEGARVCPFICATGVTERLSRYTVLVRESGLARWLIPFSVLRWLTGVLGTTGTTGFLARSTSA